MDDVGAAVTHVNTARFVVDTARFIRNFSAKLEPG
jgi:hypothetical protein